MDHKKIWVWVIALLMTVSLFPAYSTAGAVDNDFAVLETCMGSGVQDLFQKKYESGFGSFNFGGLTSLEDYNKRSVSIDMNDCILEYILIKASTMSFIYSPSGNLLAVYDKDSGKIADITPYESYYSVSVSGSTVSAAVIGEKAPGISHMSLFFSYSPRGSITVTKALDDPSLTLTQAFTFRLTGPDGYNQTRTAAPGASAAFTGLKYGDYTLTEESLDGATFIGFNGGADQSLTIKIGEGEGAVKNVTVTALNHVSGKVRIIKENLEGAKLEGAKFRISDDNDFTDNDGDEQVTTVTGGTIESGWLDPGTYYVKELEAPAGYLLDSTPRRVTVPPLGTGTVTFTNIPEDTPVGSISVTKELKDAPDNYETDAQFSFTLEGNGITKTITIGVGETGDFGDLPYGSYKLYESAIPAHFEFVEFTGYTPGTDGKITVMIGENGSTVNVTALNEKDCHLLIRKANKNDRNHTLPGAKFRLDLLNENDMVVKSEEVTIGPDGTLLNELLPGRWRVTEIEAPAGYILDPIPQEVTLKVYDEVTLTFLNEPRHDTTPTPTPSDKPTPTPTPVKPDMPRTGDAANSAIWLILAATVVFVLVYLAARRRIHDQ
jgi:uncharacterized surface anchored protein